MLALVIRRPMFAPRLGIFFLLLLAAGCTSSGPVRSFGVAASNPAVVERNLDGTVTLRSLQTHIVSVLPLNKTFSSGTFTLPSFHVIVTNGGKENVTLKPSDISAYAGDRRVALLDPYAMQERLDREQAAAGTRVSFPVGMRDASQPAEVRRGHSDLTGPRIEPFNAPTFKVPPRVIEEALQPQVIRPFEVGGGQIMLEAEHILSGLPLKIVVNVAGEKHEFLFEVRY
jgi:hypothetical protein